MPSLSFAEDTPNPLIHQPNRVGEMTRPTHVMTGTIRFKRALAGPCTRAVRLFPRRERKKGDTESGVEGGGTKESKMQYHHPPTLYIMERATNETKNGTTHPPRHDRGLVPHATPKRRERQSVRERRQQLVPRPQPRHQRRTRSP